MTRHRPRFSWLSCILLMSLGAHSACGGKDAEDKPQVTYAFSNGTEFFAAFQPLAAQVNCEALFECPAEMSFMVENYGNTANAEACAQVILSSPLSALEREILTSDRMTYDKAAGDACYKNAQNALKLGLCDLSKTETRNLEESCEEMFTGNVAQDGNCLTQAECQRGLKCEGEVSEEACYFTCVAGPCGVCAEDEYCNGSTCVERFGENRICVVGDECAVDLVCNMEVNRCEPPAPVEQKEEVLPKIARLGAACRTFGQQPLTLCEPGFVCLNLDSTTSMGTCKTPGIQDAACVFDQDCAPEFRCDFGAGTNTGTCTAREPSGEPMICDVP